MASQFAALQSVPFDGNGQGAEAEAAARAHLIESEREIEGRLASCGATSRPRTSTAP